MKFFIMGIKFHDKYKDEWSGPATILGSDGKVLFLKYGNMLRRVHITKVVKENNSFSRNSSEMGHNDDKSTNNDEHNQTSDYPEEQSIEKSNDETENMVLPKRPSLLRCPDKNRKITFKELNSDIWKEGEVIKVCKLDNKGSSCILKLDNNVEEEIDFSSGNYKWMYQNFFCERCDGQFPTRKGLNKHVSLSHKEDEAFQEKEPLVSFNISEEQVCMTTDTYLRKQIRFKEINDERSRNEEWRTIVNNTDEDEAYYHELKENDSNKEKCDEAKEKELNNFDEYKVYEEVEDEGQQVFGTRFVLTQKDDGNIKARFVIKGFQEEIQFSDSPTASRDTLKVFFSITANQKWTLEGSDVRAAFLQSDVINRDVFIEPPPQRKKRMELSGS